MEVEGRHSNKITTYSTRRPFQSQVYRSSRKREGVKELVFTVPYRDSNDGLYGIASKTHGTKVQRYVFVFAERDGFIIELVWGCILDNSS